MTDTIDSLRTSLQRMTEERDGLLLAAERALVDIGAAIEYITFQNIGCPYGLYQTRSILIAAIAAAQNKDKDDDQSES